MNDAQSLPKIASWELSAGNGEVCLITEHVSMPYIATVWGGGSYKLFCYDSQDTEHILSQGRERSSERAKAKVITAAWQQIAELSEYAQALEPTAAPGSSQVSRGRPEPSRGMKLFVSFLWFLAALLTLVGSFAMLWLYEPLYALLVASVVTFVVWLYVRFMAFAERQAMRLESLQKRHSVPTIRATLEGMPKPPAERIVRRRF